MYDQIMNKTDINPWEYLKLIERKKEKVFFHIAQTVLLARCEYDLARISHQRLIFSILTGEQPKYKSTFRSINYLVVVGAHEGFWKQMTQSSHFTVSAFLQITVAVRSRLLCEGEMRTLKFCTICRPESLHCNTRSKAKVYLHTSYEVYIM